MSGILRYRQQSFQLTYFCREYRVIAALCGSQSARNSSRRHFSEHPFPWQDVSAPEAGISTAKVGVGSGITVTRSLFHLVSNLDRMAQLRSCKGSDADIRYSFRTNWVHAQMALA